DVDVGEDHPTAALEERSLVAGDIDRDRGQDIRLQSEVVGAVPDRVELRSHGRVLELKRVAGIPLRENSSRSPDQSRRIWKAPWSRCGRRRAVVVGRELWRS